MFALGRKKQGEMNSTEAGYAACLEALQSTGEILWWKFEGIKLRLADLCFYTPDFNVMTADGELQMHEVKGFWTDDAKVKIKVAAETYPFRFFVVKKQAKKDGGGFVLTEV